MISYDMRKERDYKAENARSHIGRTADTANKMFPGTNLSFYASSHMQPIKKALGDEAYYALAASGKVDQPDWYRLAEIARLDPGLAQELAQDPGEIAPTYLKYRRVIARHKKRRVSAPDRIARAWPGVWERWCDKFDPADLPAVRYECARSIMQEMDPGQIAALFKAVT